MYSSRSCILGFKKRFLRREISRRAYIETLICSIRWEGNFVPRFCSLIHENNILFIRLE